MNENEKYDTTYKKPFYKSAKFWVIIIIVIVAIIIATAFSNTANDSAENSGDQNTSSQTQDENVTLGERNALRQAKNYLNVMPFSYQGLIDQLEFEGYSNSEAVYAANNCGADWYEQAAKKAKDYLETMPFSRQQLIKQLEFEKFTHDQAVYGAEANGY